MKARTLAYRLRNRVRELAMRVARKSHELVSRSKGNEPPPDPFAYEEELVLVGGGPHRSGAVALDLPEEYRRTDARGRFN